MGWGVGGEQLIELLGRAEFFSCHDFFDDLPEYLMQLLQAWVTEEDEEEEDEERCMGKEKWCGSC